MTENAKIGVGFGIMVLKNNQVLLGKRHSDPIKASSQLHGEGTWTMLGGKMHFGESFEESAKRELAEETGITSDNFEIISLANDVVHDAHFVTIGILCIEFNGEPQVMEPNEIVEWKWFDLDNMPTPLFFPSAKLVKNYLNKNFYKKD
mgnify:CR=1 FL=1